MVTISWDLALDPATFDLVFAGNNDLQVVEGPDVVQQRIITRIRIQRGWINDPTIDKSLGSRMKQATRLPRFRAINEIPLMVREALEPMDDVRIENITVDTESDPDGRSIRVVIEYEVVDRTQFFNVQPQTDSIIVDLPV